MTCLIEKNIVDPSLREWVMPNFTTTTDADKAIASIIMMSALQKFFSYKFSLKCGIPSVTLLGDKADWELILTRIEKIPQLGQEPAQWYQLLKPVITRLVGTFDAPDTSVTKDFWQRIAHYSGGGSGPTYLSGWITVFAFWGERGISLFPTKSMGQDTLRPVLGHVRYHQIDTQDIPPAFGSLPVKFDDNGYEYDAIMVAGSVGFRVTSSGEPLTPMTGQRHCGPTEPNMELAVGLDTVQPESGWWILAKRKEGGRQGRGKRYQLSRDRVARISQLPSWRPSTKYPDKETESNMGL